MQNSLLDSALNLPGLCDLRFLRAKFTPEGADDIIVRAIPSLLSPPQIGFQSLSVLLLLSQADFQLPAQPALFLCCCSDLSQVVLKLPTRMCRMCLSGHFCMEPWLLEC